MRQISVEVKVIVCILVLLCLGVSFQLFVLQFLPNSLFDFSIYLVAVDHFRTGQSLYGTVQDPTEFIYPPTFVRLFSLLTAAPGGELQKTIWQSLNFLALWLGGVFSVRCFFSHDQQTMGIALMALVVTFFPAIESSFSVGQVNCLLFFCYAAFFYLLQRKWDLLAGAVLGVAVFIKLTPILLLLPLVLFERFRLTFICILILSLGSVVDSSVFMEWREYLAFLPAWTATTVLRSHGSNIASYLGQGDWSSILVLLFVAIGLIKQRTGGGERGLLRSCLLCSGIPFLLSPVLWLHHLVLFLPLIFYSFGQWSLQSVTVSVARLLLTIASVVLLIVPALWSYLYPVYREVIFISMFMALFACVAIDEKSTVAGGA